MPFRQLVNAMRLASFLRQASRDQDETRSLKVYVPGDFEFTVGETESFGDDEFTITGIFVRDDAEGYRFDKFDERGDMVYAKDIKRIYGTDETTSAWSAW